jgi:DNA replication protein DnaC
MMTADGTSAPVSLPTEDYGCDYCHDSGYVRGQFAQENRYMASRAIPCPKCRPQPESQGLPEDFKHITFDDFMIQLNPGMWDAQERVKAVVNGSEWCAVLAGRPGLGKSMLAACALNETYGYFWEWGALLRNIRELAFGDRGPRLPEEDVLRGWQEGKFLLVLDDVGAEKMTEWASSTLYTILNARYQDKLPTIITTNNPQAIDERVLSRYAKGIVDCKGMDIRRR